MKEALPRPFGRYVLSSLLGQGGMGRVYRATLTGPSGFRKEVALKVIKAKEGADIAAITESFVREARVCGLLRHPNVVDVYDFGVTLEQPWLAMELVDGWPLDALLLEHPRLPATVAIDLAIQIAEGLRHAHELTVDGEALAVVHRDLKPGNVLVGRQGGAKVMDFGLARATMGEDAVTASVVVRGTPAYMSPEQAGGEAVDTRSDLFSFGILLYELAAGERPFIRDNLMAQIMALVQVEQSLADPQFLGKAEAGMPGVSGVLMKLLRRDPSDRYDRTRELVDALRDLLHRQPAGPSLRSWIDAVLLGNAPKAAFELGARTATVGTGALDGTGFAGTGGAGVRTNLAQDSAAFVGRDDDLAALQQLVTGGARIVSIVGPAGTGKTRLAKAWAVTRFEELLPRGGVWFCDLAAATELLDVAAAVAGPLGVPLDRAASADEVLDQVGYAIAGRGRVLLLLDNLEQVVAPASKALRRWSELASGALFLTTTRELLRLPGEQVLELGPLDEEAAIQLFRERARAVRPDFAVTDAVRPTVARIVRRLDCIPLAIELAAARSSVLEPAGLLERLSERWKLLSSRRGSGPERQATLRAAIEWSWNLLEPDEQSALAQCSVFRGSFDLSAVEAVVSLDGGWALDAIEALRDKSLVQAEQVRELGGVVRFRLLVSVREFAAEMLDGDARRGAEDRHGAFYVAWGEERLQTLDGPKGRSARRELASELDNLHAVVVRNLERNPVMAVRAVLVMSPVLLVTGPLQGHVALLEKAVAATGRLGAGDDADRLRIRTRLVRGTMRSVRSDYEGARADLDEALTLARSLADQTLEGEALAALGALELEQGKMSAASTTQAELAELARATGDPVLSAEAEGLAGRVVVGDPTRYDEARELLERAIASQLDLGRLSGASRLMRSLAVAHAQALQHARSTELFRRALEVNRELGNRREQATCLANLGLLANQLGEHGTARRDLEQSLRMHERLGARKGVGVLLMNLAMTVALQDELERAVEYARDAIAELDGNSGPLYLGGAWRYLGTIRHLQGRLEEASEAYERSQEILESAEQSRWMTASAWGCRAALEADRDALVPADVLLGQAEGSVLDRSGRAFVGLCRGHVELGQARTLRAVGDDEGAAELRASAAQRLAWQGLDAPPTAGAAQEATNQLSCKLLATALAAYDAQGAA